MRETLLLLCILLGGIQMYGQCVGDIHLATQAEVDAFPINYGCSVIEGELFIGTDTLGISANINNLDSLYSIVTITKDLRVQLCEIDNFEGLDNLTTVGGELYIYNNSFLQNFVGLENLANTGLLNIISNSGLTNFIGLESLVSTFGLFIVENDNLSNFTGLENLTSLDSGLSILGNQSLSSFWGLQNVENIGAWLHINHGGSNLISFEGLESLTSLGGINLIESSIQSFEGLEDLTGLDDLYLDGNQNLQNFTGLNNMLSIQEDINILNHENIESFEGLENLANIGGGLQIENNNKLVNFEGLNNLESIEGYAFIWWNDDLLNFEGLESLESIGEELDIEDNDNLINLIGLDNLTDIGGNLRIWKNDGLISLAGIDNLQSIGDDVFIELNPQLGHCCAILNWADIIESEVILENNAFTCNTIEIIANECTDVKIQIVAFHDQNNNDLFDDPETFLLQNFNLIPDNSFSYADEEGFSNFYLSDYGNYQIIYNDGNPLWTCVNSCDTIEIAYLDSTFQDTTIYFPIQSFGDYTIQDIDLTSSITRCNRETNYWITYSNTGTVTTSGYVELIPDETVEFVSAEPQVDSISGSKLYWFYNDLHPTHSEKIKAIFEMPSVDFIGEVINFEAYIETNEGNAGRKAFLDSELVCAYDPNDKLVTPYGYGEENYTLFGDTLEYTIRFQNTGNDTAFNVVITDTLSTYLDVKSFYPISNSHNVETQLDVGSRAITFTFNDIYLPDSFVNESASHGFVKYRILGEEELSENTDIQNTAYIYFDQNPAIVTNTVSNRMVSVLPVISSLFETSALSQTQVRTYPNPTEGQLYIETKNGNIQNIQIRNSQGDLLLEQKTATRQSSLDLSKWGSGLYFIQVQTGQGVAVQKVIIP